MADVKLDDWIVDEIKAALRKAPDIPSVNATVRHFLKEILAMQKSRDPYFKVMAIHIENLTKYRRWEHRRTK